MQKHWGNPLVLLDLHYHGNKDEHVAVIKTASMVTRPRAKFVACPLHGDDQFRPCGIRLEFLAKAVNMHIHGSRECLTVVFPDRAQQLLTGHEASGPFHEVAQKPKL